MPKLGESYGKCGASEAQAHYAAWANTYEGDLLAAGYRLPAVFAAVVTRHLPPDTAPILDAGCGGGLQSEPLKHIGYSGLHGADLSEEMMQVARAKSIYQSLTQITLGEALPWVDNYFAAAFCCGTITPGHAPPESFDELTRVTRPGGLVIFSMRDDPGQRPEYPAHVAALSEAGRWREVFRTPAFASIPIGEPEVHHRVHVQEVLS